MGRQTYPKLAFDRATARDIAMVANSLRDGKVNSVGEFTIPSSHDPATPWVVPDPYVTEESYIHCMPASAGAANATPIVTNIVNGVSFEALLEWSPMQDRYAHGGFALGGAYVPGTGLIDYKIAQASLNMDVNVTTDQITLQRSGRYKFDFGIYAIASNNGALTWEIRANATPFVTRTFTYGQQTGLQGQSISIFADLLSGDVIDVNISAVTGGPSLEDSHLTLDMAYPEFVAVDRTYRYTVLG